MSSAANAFYRRYGPAQQQVRTEHASSGNHAHGLQVRPNAYRVPFASRTFLISDDKLDRVAVETVT